jgi:hypothetical protein
MKDAPFASARNPRALVEIALGHPVDWSTVDERQLLEDVLQTPYEELFDPRYDTPVHLGVRVTSEGDVVEEPPPFQQLHDHDQGDGGTTDVDRYPDVDLTAIRHVGDLKELVGGSVDDAPVRSVIPSRAGGWSIEIGQLPGLRDAALARVFDKSTLAAIWSSVFVDLGWTPPNGEWADVGSFFKEAAEYFDPIQSGLADCWLVSAMSSVAWALPYTYAQRTRATGTGNDQFVNLIEIIDPANGQRHDYELTDQTVVYSGTSTQIYSHSSEPGELWPAIIEKAVANFRRGTSIDHPDLTSLNYGDCVWASALLTGRSPNYTNTNGTSVTDLIHFVKSHSMSYRTFDPVTAWTYSSGDSSPDHVVYSDANLVANHCYSVLGWTRGYDIVRPHLANRLARIDTPQLRALAAGAGMATSEADLARIDVHELLSWYLSRDYIVLRNPWGYCEATSGQLKGVIPMRDISFWRSIDLDTSDGVFAIDFDTFKRYFAGIGVAL